MHAMRNRDVKKTFTYTIFKYKWISYTCVQHTIMTSKFVMALNIPLFLMLYSSNRKLNNINYKILRNVTVFIKLSKNPIFFESFFIINGFGLIYISCASQAVLSQHSNFLYYRNKCPRRNQQT